MILIHGTIMMAGLVLVAWGIMCAIFFRRKRWWLKAHKSAGYGGTGVLLIGALTAIIALSLSGEGHMRTPHAFIGSAGIALAIVAPVLGVLQIKNRILKSLHRWSGRITGAVILVNAVLGLFLVEIL